MNGSAGPLVGKFAADGWDVFDDLADASGIVLAVSGGPDSTALMHLAALWRNEAALPSVWIGTVDHGLRPEGRSEAESVAAAAVRLGFPAAVLTWTGEKPKRALQEAARDARYALLEDYAGRVGASHLVTAHTLDDQAETVLFRLAHGSGVTGLGGMHRRSMRGTLIHIRPFLGIHKASLVELCETSGWAYTTDPANADPRFARARLRHLSPILAREGLTPERLGLVASRLARADQALTVQAESAAAGATVSIASRQHKYRFDDLAGLPLEIVIRVLRHAVSSVASSPAPIRLERLERCADACLTAHRSRSRLARTLHHCRIVLDQRGVLTVSIEPVRRRGRTSVLASRSP